MSSPKKEWKGRRMSGTALQVAVSAGCLLLGVLLTFVPQVNIRTLCYVFCVLLVAAGVAAIVYFFLSGAYRRLDDYNFALGVMLLILGCCGFARIEAMEGGFLGYLGFAVLVLGIVALQNTVQLRVVNSGAWICALVFTVVILFGGITILLDLKAVWNLVRYWILIVSGVLGLACLTMTAIVLHRLAKEAAARPAPEPIPEPVREPAPEPKPVQMPEPPAPPEPEASPEQEKESFGNLQPHDPPPPEA